MKLIVEAGSTKTDSILLLRNGKTGSVARTQGINPVTDKDHNIAVKLLADVHDKNSIEEIHYYGSGCINQEVNEGLSNLMTSYFGNEVNIFVNDDLVAVGKGMCQRQPGIVGILGTGSNIGYYDGARITERINSCGYLLGDEGSGYQIGRSIYRRFARGTLTKSNEAHIKSNFGIAKERAIQHLYNQSNPRRFLASFAIVALELPTHVRATILDEVFDPFIDRMIIPLYNRHQAPINLIGSVAYHFSEEIKYKLGKFDIIAASFETSPLTGLIKYHTNE